MEIEFVPYNESLELKELGFDEPCLSIYDKDGKLQRSLIEYPIINSKNGFYSKWSIITAPLFQQAFKWFREKHGLEGVVQRSQDFVWYKWKISQYNEDSKKYVADWYEYEAYEEAELACLRKLIEIVKNK